LNTTTIQLVGEFDLTKKSILKIVDEHGRQVNPKVTKNSNSFEVNLIGLKSGIYYYQVQNGDKVISNGKLLKIE
jgi:hypothetical protein